MSDNTRIEWCDATWNPMWGCTAISDGCAYCYARGFCDRYLHRSDFTPRFVGDEIVPSKTYTRLEIPLHWRKPRRIFVCSMSDLFHEAYRDEQIDRVIHAMLNARQHTYMVLTKRPERMRDFFGAFESFRHKPPRWLWLGVTAENQQRADERIPLLLDTPASMRFVSIEPMLGPVALDKPTERERHAALNAGFAESYALTMIDQLDLVILGGESGPGARPMQPEWALDVWQQCKAAGVPFYFKQWGTWAHRCVIAPNWPNVKLPAATWSVMRQMEATKELPWRQP